VEDKVNAILSIKGDNLEIVFPDLLNPASLVLHTLFQPLFDVKLAYKERPSARLFCEIHGN